MASRARGRRCGRTACARRGGRRSLPRWTSSFGRSPEMALAEIDLRSGAREHRPVLPPHDPILRATAVLTWRARMVNEHSSSAVFESLAAQLADNGFATE